MQKFEISMSYVTPIGNTLKIDNIVIIFILFLSIFLIIVYSSNITICHYTDKNNINIQNNIYIYIDILAWMP